MTNLVLTLASFVGFIAMAMLIALMLVAWTLAR